MIPRLLKRGRSLPLPAEGCTIGVGGELLGILETVSRLQDQVKTCQKEMEKQSKRIAILERGSTCHVICHFMYDRMPEFMLGIIVMFVVYLICS